MLRSPRLPHPSPGPAAHRETFWLINQAAVASRGGPVPHCFAMTMQQEAALRESKWHREESCSGKHCQFRNYLKPVGKWGGTLWSFAS